MVRKTAQTKAAETKPEDEAKLADLAAGDPPASDDPVQSGSDTSADALTNTEGENAAGDASDAPHLSAPAANDLAPGDGEIAPDLPVTSSPEDDAPAIQAEAEGADATDLVVICHKAEGRRRAGRRWPKGETRVREDELTAYQLAQLRGDPLFTVRSIEKG